MSDKIPDLDGFETDDLEIPEVITLRPGEEVPVEKGDEEEDTKITLTKDEYEALKKGTDSNSALLDGFKGLQDVLKGSNQGPSVNVQQQPGESDDDFEKRLEKELFAEGKTGKALKEAISRYGGSQIGELMGIISKQNRDIMEMHPEKGKVFSRYKDEIEDIVKGLPANQQYHPGVWDYALDQVKIRHKDEMQNETVESIVEQRVKERLETLGISEDGTVEKKASSMSKGSFVESGRGSPSMGKVKKPIYITEEEKRDALASGIDPEIYVQSARYREKHRSK